MHPEEIPLSEFADIIAAKARQKHLAVLAGAGISTVSPSGLPDGNGLRDLVLRNITDTLVGTPELYPYYDLLINDTDYTNLQPELVFRTLWEYMGDSLREFFGILETAERNEIHLFLSELRKRFSATNSTTNFERLIEGIDGEFYYALHLHGCLGKNEIRGFRPFQTGRAITFAMADVFFSYVKGRSLLILGYSGRDADVMNLINKSRAEEILWLVHNDSAREAMSTVASDPRIRYAVGDAGDLAAGLRGRLQMPQPYEGVNYGDAKYGDAGNAEYNRDILILDWQDKLPPYKRYLAVAAVLVLAKNFSAANGLLNLGLAALENSKYREQYLTGAAEIFCMAAGYEKGIDSISEALAAAKDIHCFQYARMLNISGLLYLEKTEPEILLAIEQFKRAKACLKEVIGRSRIRYEEDQLLLTRILDNQGRAYEAMGDFAKAAEAYKKSVKVKHYIGDITGYIQMSAKISLLCYRIKDYTPSYYWRKRTIETTRTYGQDMVKIDLLFQTGVEAFEMGRHTVGLRLLYEAAESAEKIQGAGGKRRIIEETIKRFEASRHTMQEFD